MCFSLYKNNKIISNSENRHGFESYNYLNSTANLYLKNYVGMNTQCKEKLLQMYDSNKLINDFINIEEIMDHKIRRSILGMIFLGFGLFTVMFFNKGTIQEGLDKKEIVSWTFLLLVFLSIPALLFAILQLYHIRYIKINYDIFSDPFCFENDIAEILKNFGDGISNGDKFMIYNTLFACTGIIFNFYSSWSFLVKFLLIRSLYIYIYVINSYLTSFLQP